MVKVCQNIDPGILKYHNFLDRLKIRSDHENMTNETKPLTFLEKLSYGIGDFGTAITTNLLSFYLLFFFTNIAGIPPGKAGLILLVGKFWDGINDPMIGILSDRTRSDLGRRLPWMIYGAIPFGLSFGLQWLIPTTNADLLFWYYIVISLLFNTFYTAVNLPYTALTAELTQDYNERTSLNSFRFSFSIGGSILSLVIALGIFALLSNRSDRCTQSFPYLILGLVMSLLAIASTFVCILGIRKRVKQQSIENPIAERLEIPFFEQIKIAFSNSAFLYVIGIYFCSWLALQITASIIPYYVTDWMKLSSSEFTKVMIGVQGTALFMLFVWSKLSTKLGKRAVFFMGISLWIIAQLGLYLLRPGQVILMYFMAIVAGCGLSTAYLIPWSMIPDVTDLDELNSGARREGIFYAFMVLLQKLGLAFGLFLLGIMLERSGFIQAEPCAPLPIQPDSALQAIRIAIAPIPAVLLLLSLALAYFYPLTKERHDRVRLKLQQRKENNLI